MATSYLNQFIPTLFGQVEQALEKRITALLREVEGVGSCRVMVTLESGTQMVYAADTVSSAGADGAASLSESYLTVDTDTGPVGLLLTRIQPTVKGVAVVCDGGGSVTVQNELTSLLSAALSLPSTRIHIAPSK